MMLRSLLPALIAFCLFPQLNDASAQAPANSKLVVNEAFDAAIDDQWHVNTGKWQAVGGVLRAGEVEADKHSAAARRTVETENAVYQLRFRFVEAGKAFHLGFDPAPGELNKRGHLFSIIVTPQGWKILKHTDKDRPDEEPNETLAESETGFENGRWYTLRVTTWEDYVTAQINGMKTLKASHPTFGVKKPTLVFRCLGDGVEIDDLKVWSQNES